MRRWRPAPTRTTEVRHERASRRIAALVLGVGLVAGLFAAPASAQVVTESVFRFYNRQTGTHFYTISAAERDRVIGAYPQFAYEGAMFDAGDDGAWIPTIAIERYGATLARWFGVPVARLPEVFPNLGMFAIADLGFRV